MPAARDLGAGEAELKSRNQAPREAGAQAAATANRLAGGDGRRITSSAPRTAPAWSSASAHAVERRGRAAAARRLGVQLDVERRPPRRAQVLGQDAADLAVADQGDVHGGGSVDVAQARPSSGSRILVHVQAQHAGGPALARLSPSLGLRARRRPASWAIARGTHDHAVVVGHDHVARLSPARRRTPRDVHRAERGLDRALCC